jgi:hypothetical protein
VVVVDGDTLMEFDVMPVFQYHEVPPLTLRFTLSPRQMVVSGLTVVAMGVLTVTVTVSVVLHWLVWRLVTVYVVVVEGET